MKNLLLSLSFVFITSLLLAVEVDKSTAKKVAVNFSYERIDQSSVDHASIEVAETYALKLHGETMMYAVNMKDGGFVLVSAHDLLRPVPGYSLSGKYTGLGLPPQLEELIYHYKLQINAAAEAGLPADEETQNMWENLKTDDPSTLRSLKLEKEVIPMLTTTWDQGEYYNEMCPVDSQGPGGHCYAGCVATALGQVVNYFRWPETGTGSYTYECPPYGTLTADFGATTYEWDKMATSLNESNLATALLLHHLGIACDMVYGPNGSGMYNHKAAYALHSFFKYSPETIYVYRDSTSLDWDSLLITHLDRAIPMYYAGWSVPNINGHAFVCDGYQADNYYHFNWGWSGSYDGYFYTDNLSPGGSNFNLAQELIINAYPDTNAYNYPYYCQGDKLLENIQGTIDDGSGPVNDYAPDANCSWLIAPQDSISSITLEFLSFNTASGDILTVYDGETSSAPVLGTFQGTEIPEDVTSTGDRILITFNSDASGEAAGWLLSYEGAIPEYCPGISILDEQSGFITDGSGPRDYHNNTNCFWIIEPPGASEITLYFTDFHTEEGNDGVKVFNSETNEVLAWLFGDINPDPITSPSGKMAVRFNTNATITAPGWDAYFETDLVSVKEKSIAESLKIFPNPATEQINISFISDIKQLVLISISNIMGQEMYSQEMMSDTGENAVKIAVNNLESGIYLLKLNYAGESTYSKLIIQ